MSETKDWVGNYQSIYRVLGASNHTDKDREPNDYYATEPKAMEAKEFFMKFFNADCPKIAIENPTPMKLVGLPPYSQAIQPYQFGHPYTKRTCLWLKNLPLLTPTNIVTEGVTPYVKLNCNHHSV